MSTRWFRLFAARVRKEWAALVCERYGHSWRMSWLPWINNTTLGPFMYCTRCKISCNDHIQTSPENMLWP